MAVTQKICRLTERMMTMGTEQLIKKLSEREQMAHKREIEQAIDEAKGNCKADENIRRIWDRLRVTGSRR